MTIRKYIEHLEKIIDSSSIVLSSDIQKFFGPTGESVFLKGRITFGDSSCLELAIFASVHEHSMFIDKYRFHYMLNSGEMVFRYDNAPHYPEISTFPHHKHLPSSVVPSKEPTLKDIFNELSSKIIEKNQ